jgi:hypothetical protein
LRSSGAIGCSCSSLPSNCQRAVDLLAPQAHPSSHRALRRGLTSTATSESVCHVARGSRLGVRPPMDLSSLLRCRIRIRHEGGGWASVHRRDDARVGGREARRPGGWLIMGGLPRSSIRAQRGLPCRPGRSGRLPPRRDDRRAAALVTERRRPIPCPPAAGLTSGRAAARGASRPRPRVPRPRARVPRSTRFPRT